MHSRRRHSQEPGARSERAGSVPRSGAAFRPPSSDFRPLAVIVPVHNEARSISQLLKRVLAQPDVGQLIVVDDASKDDSLAIVRTAVRAAPRGVDVTVIPLTPNQGKGAAVTRGFTLVSQPFVIIQDADLEYDPADYHQLLEPLVAGQTRVVFGSRFLTRDRGAVTLHDAGNRFLSWFTSWLFGVRLTDMNTCYKCFDSTLIANLHCTERRFAWDPQLTAQLIRLGQGIVERPIRYQPRTIEEGKQLRWQDGFAQLRVLTREWLRAWPAAQWRLLVSLAASATLLAGLAANQFATIERIEGKPFAITESLRLGRSIALDRTPHCQTGVGFVIAGPYVTLPPGRYRYRAMASAAGPIRSYADVSSGPLHRTFTQVDVNGEDRVPILFDVTLDRWASKTEFRVVNSQPTALCVSDQSLERTDLDPFTTLIDTLTPVRNSQLSLPPKE